MPDGSVLPGDPPERTPVSQRTSPRSTPPRTSETQRARCIQGLQGLMLSSPESFSCPGFVVIAAPSPPSPPSPPARMLRVPCSLMVDTLPQDLEGLSASLLRLAPHRRLGLPPAYCVSGPPGPRATVPGAVRVRSSLFCVGVGANRIDTTPPVRHTPTWAASPRSRPHARVLGSGRSTPVTYRCFCAQVPLVLS